MRNRLIRTLLLSSLLLLFGAGPVLSQIKGFYDGNTYYIEEIVRNPPARKATYLQLGFGPSNYLGDLGGNTGLGRAFFYDNNFKKRTFFYGFSLSHLRRDAVGLKLGFNAGRLAASDHDAAYTSTTDNAYTRYKRNLDFRTNIREWSLMLEVFPLKIMPYQYGVHHWTLQPYLMGGIGRFTFNPQGSYYDEIADDYVWVDLQPLRLEGQGMAEFPNRKPYKLAQLNLPFGMGLRYETGQKTSLSFEFVGRHLFTDYLDDVSTNYIDPVLFDQYLNPEDAALARLLNNKSGQIDPDNPYQPGQQRGNPTKRDFFYSFNVRLGIRISKMKVPKFLKKQYKFDDSEICE